MSAGIIYLAAGGTGGHIFPALAVAETMNAKGYQTCLFTDKRGAALLADIAKLPVRLYVISAASPFQSGIFRRIMALTKLGMGALSCLWHIGLRPPMVMIGFGGYPPGRDSSRLAGHKQKIYPMVWQPILPACRFVPPFLPNGGQAVLVISWFLAFLVDHKVQPFLARLCRMRWK